MNVCANEMEKAPEFFISDTDKFWLAATQTGCHVPPDGKGQK